MLEGVRDSQTQSQVCVVLECVAMWLRTEESLTGVNSVMVSSVSVKYSSSAASEEVTVFQCEAVLAAKSVGWRGPVECEVMRLACESGSKLMFFRRHC